MSWRSTVPLTALAILIFVGCERDISGLDPLSADTNPTVFADDFEAGMDFQAFMGSKVDALAIDNNDVFQGSAALRFTVPEPSDPTGSYAGGAFTTRFARDLSSYNALTFWAKSSKTSTLNVVGLGNDNTGTSRYTAQWNNVPLTTTWTKFVVPIPLPEKLNVEQGLFFLAEGSEGGASHEVWFDEVQFEFIEGITNPRPAMTPKTLNSFAGETIDIEGTQVTFNVDGTDRTVEHMPGYFTFTSSDEEVVKIEGETITVVGAGTAEITGALDGVAATGVVTVNATAPPPDAAPTPTHAAEDVISLFSDAYDDVTVDTWSAEWDAADVADIQVAGDNVKVYTNLTFSGIEFGAPTIDATEMNFFHMDVWIPLGREIRIKLVDFGDDGEFQGDPDSESEVAFSVDSDPPLVLGSWVSLDIPMADFSRLQGRAHLAQLILWADFATNTVYVDNVYFHK